MPLGYSKCVDSLTLYNFTLAHNPWHASAHYGGTGQSIPNNTFTGVIFDTVDYDPNNNMTVGASSFYTAPVSGIYHVATTVELGTMSGPVYIRLVLDNTTPIFEGGTYVTSANPFPHICRKVQLAAGHTLYVQVYQASGASVNTQATNTTYDVGFLYPV